MTTAVYSGVIGEHPRYAHQALIWAASLIELAGVSPDDIHVHSLVGRPSRAAELLAGLGCRVEFIRPFDDRMPYCNKIGQLPVLAGRLDADTVILSDLDIIYLTDVRAHLPLEDIARGQQIHGVVVGHASPDRDTFEAFLADPDVAGQLPPAAAARLQEPDVWNRAGRRHASETLYSNLNGGLLVLPRQDLERHHEAWTRWALTCADKEAVLGRHAWHAFQIAVAMAALELDIAVHHLRLGYNLSLHMNAADGAHDEPALALHYHRSMTVRSRLPAEVPDDRRSDVERANVWLEESSLVRDLVKGLDPVTRSRALADRAYWTVRHRAAAARRAQRTRGQGTG